MNELATIRRAYRYVVAYQRRILDAMSVVDEVIVTAGLERHTPHRWSPLYFSFPTRDWAPAKWAWDQVPSFACRYRWNGGAPNTAGSRYVLVDHVADTALEAQQLGPHPAGEPDALDLGDPAASRSILRFLVIELSAPLPESTWNLYWPQLLAKQMGVPYADLLDTASRPAPLRREAGSMAVTTWSVDLADLSDAAALEDRFISPLRDVLGRRSVTAA